MLFGRWLHGKRLLTAQSFLFVTKKEAKKCHRSDAVDAGRGCGPGPRDAATLRRPTQVLGDLSKEKIKNHQAKFLLSSRYRAMVLKPYLVHRAPAR